VYLWISCWRWCLLLQCFGDSPGGYLVFYFLRFLQAGYHPSCLDFFRCSFSDSGPSYDISQMLRMSLLIILSCRVLLMMHLKVFNFYEHLLHLLIETYPVFYSVCLWFPCHVDVQFSHQRFGGRPGGLGLFHFPLFGIFASRLSSILFRSLHVCFLILVYFMISRRCCGYLRCQFYPTECYRLSSFCF